MKYYGFIEFYNIESIGNLKSIDHAKYNDHQNKNEFSPILKVEDEREKVINVTPGYFDFKINFIQHPIKFHYIKINSIRITKRDHFFDFFHCDLTMRIKS